jgi:hypothetical protein
VPSDSLAFYFAYAAVYNSVSLKKPLAFDPKAGVSTLPLFFFSGTTSLVG